MRRQNETVNSFDEFVSEPKTNGDGDKQKSKQNDLPPSLGIAALMRSQPLILPRQTSLETNPNANSKTTSMTTNDKNPPAPLPPKPKDVDSPPAKTYESDVDDEKNTDGKKKHSSLPPPKQRSHDTSRRGSDSEVKASYTVSSNPTPRKEKFLPYIRPKNRRKGFVKPPPPPEKPKTEAEQRVASAQNEKVNELRSRLSLIRRQLEQERVENRTLCWVQKREEKSLQGYEEQEYSANKVVQDYKKEIAYVKDQIHDEKDDKKKIQKELDERDEVLRDQTKRLKFYEKLVAHEDDYEEYNELRDKLKETDKQLKKFEEKIAKQEKHIEDLEQKYRQEVAQELSKRRDLKHEVDDQSKKYTDLFLKYEHHARQVDTMHIYILRGGRRPSDSTSDDLAKSRSFQEVQDTSSQFRDKMLDYDKKRREQEKDKPKPPPRPIKSPPKPERKVYVPSIDLKLKPKPKPEVKKPSPEPAPVIHEEKPPVVEIKHIPRVPSPVRRLSTPKSYDDDNSEFEEDMIIESAYVKPRSPSPPPRISIPPPRQRTPPASLFRITEPPPPPPPVKPPVTRDFDDKWLNIFANDKKEEPAKQDLLSKLTTETPQEKKPKSSMVMFEPSSTSTHHTQKKPPPRVVTSVYDFEQAVINLHDGKPVTAQSTTNKTSADPYESSSGNISTTKPTNRLYGRDDSLNKPAVKHHPSESRADQATSEASTLTTTKPNSRQIPVPIDKLQRPKVVTNAPRPVPNRTVVEEIEEFLL